MIGIYNAVGLQYRFAAAEVAAPADKAKAISLVLAGGIVGGFLGPESARLRDGSLRARRSWGSFLVLAAYALVALAVQSRVRVPAADASRSAPAAGGRCRRSCASRCSSSPRSPAGWATGS